MGKPYVWGATGPSTYDCSGLVGYALTGHHRRIGDASLRQKIFQTGKSLWNIVLFHGAVSPRRNGFHDGADFNSFFPEVGGVDAAPLSGSDECNSHMGSPCL